MAASPTSLSPLTITRWLRQTPYRKSSLSPPPPLSAIPICRPFCARGHGGETSIPLLLCATGINGTCLSWHIYRGTGLREINRDCGERIPKRSVEGRVKTQAFHFINIRIASGECRRKNRTKRRLRKTHGPCRQQWHRPKTKEESELFVPLQTSDVIEIKLTRLSQYAATSPLQLCRVLAWSKVGRGLHCILKIWQQTLGSAIR